MPGINEIFARPDEIIFAGLGGVKWNTRSPGATPLAPHPYLWLALCPTGSSGGGADRT